MSKAANTRMVRATIVDPQPAPSALITTPAQLVAHAVMSGAGMDQVRELMALQERWEQNEARKAYVAAMAAFKAEPVDIRKTKAVGYETRDKEWVGYNHATIADVVDAVVPAMAKHGLSHAWDVKQSGAQITVTCTITHALGHRESVEMSGSPDNSGKKNAIQQVASTVTYLQRYTLMAATGVAAKEMDDDGRGAGPGHPDDAGDEDPDHEDLSRGPQPAGPVDPRAKARHDAAYARHSESITFIKDRIAAGDLQAVKEEWYAISQDDQRALWLATSKGGCLTTAERRTIKEDLPK